MTSTSTKSGRGRHCETSGQGRHSPRWRSDAFSVHRYIWTTATPSRVALGSKAFASLKHLENGFFIVFRVSVRFLKHNSCHALMLGDW
jgi:hypothetical protein